MNLTLPTVSCYCIAVTTMLQLLMLLFTEGCASNPCHDNCRCEDTEHTFRCVCPEQHGVHGLITHTPSKSSLSQKAFIAVVLWQQRYENDDAHIGLISLRIWNKIGTMVVGLTYGSRNDLRDYWQRSAASISSFNLETLDLLLPL